jgi:hypothetical protein
VGSNPLSKAGFTTFDTPLTQLVGPGAAPISDEQVVFQVNAPGGALITLQLRPVQEGVPPTPSRTHYELSIKVDDVVQPQEVARIAFGLTASEPVGHADMSFGGCQDLPPEDTREDLFNSLRGCQNRDPILLTARADEETAFLADGSADISTYTVGPDATPNGNRLPNTLYVALDSGFTGEFGDIPINNGGDQWLGVVVFPEAADPPQITFLGTVDLPGFEDGPVVSVGEILGGQNLITDQNVTLSNTSSTSSDTDGDGNPDDLDNCSRVDNPDQVNTGGVGFVYVDGEPKFEKIGDACQCGDPGRDGVADNGSAEGAGEGFNLQDDVVKCQEALSGQGLPLGEVSGFCKVTTTEGSFSIVDVVVLEADTAVPGSSGLGDPLTGSLQSCGAAEGQL